MNEKLAAKCSRYTDNIRKQLKMTKRKLRGEKDSHHQQNTPLEIGRLLFINPLKRQMHLLCSLQEICDVDLRTQR